MEVAKLERQVLELKSKGTPYSTGPTSTRTDDSEVKRILNTNLLKGQELTRFNKKDNYDILIDCIKNDLYS